MYSDTKLVRKFTTRLGNRMTHFSNFLIAVPLTLEIVKSVKIILFSSMSVLFKRPSTHRVRSRLGKNNGLRYIIPYTKFVLPFSRNVDH